MNKRRTRTFADVVSGEFERPVRSDHVERVPGEFNESRQLFDLDGYELTRTKAHVTAKEGLALIASGALAASEGCGCGGWVGCQPVWLPQGELRILLSNGKPRMLKGDCPTWIDVWTGNGSTLVFAHGDIAWT
jgi:hypothetical protein